MNRVDGNNVPQSRFIELLLHTENRILSRLGDAEFQHGFGGNLDLLSRLRDRSLELRTEPGKCVGLDCDVEFVRAIIEFPQVSVGSPNLIIVKGDARMSGLHALDGK